MTTMIILSVGVFYVVFFWFAAAQNRQREMHPASDRPLLSNTIGH